MSVVGSSGVASESMMLSFVPSCIGTTLSVLSLGVAGEEQRLVVGTITTAVSWVLMSQAVVQAIISVYANMARVTIPPKKPILRTVMLEVKIYTAIKLMNATKNANAVHAHASGDICDTMRECRLARNDESSSGRSVILVFTNSRLRRASEFDGSSLRARS